MNHGVPGFNIKHCKDDVSTHLIRIFNNMIDLGIYPDILKTHKITAIPKVNNSTTAEIYRQIAVLSAMDNVIERILHHLLNDYQYGFRKGCGTEETVVNVVNYISEGLDDGHSDIVGLLFDLRKAFDMVDHGILLEKLSLYGV